MEENNLARGSNTEKNPTQPITKMHYIINCYHIA